MSYEETLIYDMRKLPEDRKKLDTITNPQEYKWRSMSIADRERLLDQLTDEERFIFEELVINKKQGRQLTQHTGMTVNELYTEREDIIMKLCQMRYGVVYAP